MRENPKAQEFYRHFKNKLYQIVAIAEHSETKEPLVIYQALYGDYRIYARPLAMFMSEVDHVKYPEVTQKYRFEKVVFTAKEDEPVHVVKVSRENTDKETFAVKGDSVEAVAAEAESGEVVEEELNLDPLVIEFFDADTYEEKLRILTGLHHRITDDMITTMALSCELEVKEGELEERYEELKNCLLTLEKYECNRLR